MQLLIHTIGSDNTAYFLSFIAVFLWFIGFVFTAENPKLNFAACNIWRGLALIFISAGYFKYKGMRF
jgi:hypothetical protein